MRNELRVISEQSKKYAKLQTLMYHINMDSLKEEHRRMNPKKAVGVDGVTKDIYSLNLDENINDLLDRMKRMRYRPKPTRLVEIPKEDGRMRKLGISSYEDKLVEGIMGDILSLIYEERFYDCSYGFRSKRNMHKAVGVINHALMFEKINYVIDCDIKAFFDNIDHKWMTRFLENDIEDRKFIQYVVRFLKSGIMADGEYQSNNVGTKQGNKMSPVLANVYLHYVLDDWFERGVKKSVKGNVRLVRFADDFIIMCQREDEAIMILDKLEERLSKFGLELNKDKTKIIPFGRYKGTKETFDFLGFTFINGKTREGKYTVHIQTSKKKMKKSKANIKTWLKANMHKPIWETLQMIKVKIIGHYNYYGINGNYKSLVKYYKYVKYKYYRTLRKRGQKHPIKYKDYLRIWKASNMPLPKLCVNIWF